MIGAKSTNALIAMIYKKQMRLSQATNKSFGLGEVVNFCQVDAMQLMYMCFSLNDATTLPLVLIYSFTYLFYTLGLSFFSGIGVFLVAFVTNAILGVKLEKYQSIMMKKKDLRMNHTNEALSNIKTLKFYQWTDIFEKEIQQRRINEFKIYWKLAYYLAAFITSLYFFPNILSSVVFSTYIGTGHPIDLATSFSVLVFFDLIKDPMRQLPTCISTFI